MRIFLLGLLVFLPWAETRAADWEVASHEPGLTIYTRRMPGQDLKDFRGVVRVQASMREVLAALVDVENMPQWFYSMREARVLEVDGPQGSFLYFVLAGMGPVSDRDAVVRVAITQDPQTLVLNLSGDAAPEYYPPVRGRVRIPRLQSSWTLTPLAAGETEVRLDGHADPGGRIPVWVANLVVTALPQKTLQGLRTRLEARDVDTAVLNRDPRVASLLAAIKFPEFP